VRGGHVLPEGRVEVRVPDRERDPPVAGLLPERRAAVGRRDVRARGRPGAVVGHHPDARAGAGAHPGRALAPAVVEGGALAVAGRSALIEQYTRQGNTTMAIELCCLELAEHPDDANVHALLALNLMRAKRMAAAEHEAVLALRSEPELVRAHLVYGW